VLPSLQILLTPVPRHSFWRARGLNPSSTESTLATWEAPAVAWFCFVIWEAKKPRNSADRKHHTGQNQPLPQQPHPQKHPGALLTCSFQSPMLRHHRFCCIRYQKTQNYHHAYEKSRAPRSSLLPPQLTSLDQCQRRPAQPLQNRERHVSLSCCTIICSRTLTRPTTASPFQTCCQHTALLLQGYVQHLQKNQSKQHMLRYWPKPKLACINPNLLLLYLAAHPLCPCHFQVPWAEQFQGKHRGTDQHYSQHHKQWDSRREKTLRKKNDSLTGDTVGQGDQQGRSGPERGGSMAAPENRIRTEWSVTRSYSQNGDNGCARSPASRPKSIRMQGRSPTVHKNGPEESRAAGTTWNDTAKERRKTDPRFTLVRQEEKIWMGTMPMSTRIWDPRYGTEAHDELCECKEKQGHRDQRKVCDKTHHKNNIAPETQATTALATWAEEKPLSSLYMPKRARSWTALSPTLTLQALPAIPSHGALPPVPQLSFWRARGLNPSLTKSTLANWEAPAVAWFRFVIWKGKNPETVLTVSITLAKTNLFHNNPLLRSTRVLCSPARSRVRRCSHHRFCYRRYQVTKLPLRPWEVICPTLPPWLTSRACPMPQVAHSAPAKPKEIRFTELLHNTLLSHTDPAHNCLAFSDVSMLLCPSESACGICNNHSKETHVEILPKTTQSTHTNCYHPASTLAAHLRYLCHLRVAMLQLGYHLRNKQRTLIATPTIWHLKNNWHFSPLVIAHLV